MTATTPPNPAAWSCPMPLRDYPAVVLGHGGGGRLTAELVEHLCLPAFRGGPLDGVLEELGDAAVLGVLGARLAFTTDAYVVHPRFFPGGNIGDLAVNGTVNDLAVGGARPLALSAALILEEGLPVAELGIVVETMGAAARAAGVSIVAGDTKVVERGRGDGLYVTTAGVGVIPDGIMLGPKRIQPDDVVLLSGPIAAHGVAVLSVRDGLEFESEIVSDTAPLHELTAALLGCGAEVAVMRDCTRGGVAAVLNELAAASGCGIEIRDDAVPVLEPVRAACGILGLDPLYVANEGRLVAIVRAGEAETALAAMRSVAVGAQSVAIGHTTAEHPGIVVARTAIGGTRVVDLPLGEQLPRIC
ncbi:MAG: hydrogenase expression/formation protein HypE [Tetrasphaera sp.]